MSTFRAFLSRDKQTVLMMTDRRRETVTVDRALEWRAFYRRMWARGSKKPGEPGPYARHYEQTCQVLDRIAAEIKGGT